MILSVDPGVRQHGCALWENAELVGAWLTQKGNADIASEITQFAPIETVQGLVIECPQIYTISKSKGGIKGQNDLIKLAIAAGRLIGHLAHYDIALEKTYLPFEWKRQVPKEVMTKRIRRVLSEEELARIELPSAKSLAHNVYDGIGIGLRHHNREYDPRMHNR